MPVNILIIVDQLRLEAQLFDTPCGRAVAAALPVETVPNEWGDEFYFEVPVACSPDDTATMKVKAGDVAYWPPGRALAIFFGRTPMSTGPDPVPASEVNLVGRIIGDATVLRKAKGANRIRIEKR